MRHNIKIFTGALFIMLLALITSLPAFGQKEHFDPKGKAPSDFTIAKWDDLKNKMPLIK